MALTKFTQDIEVISKLDDEPNDVGGLSPAELKAKYDEAGGLIKSYINDVLLPALDAYIARTDNPHAVTKTQVGLGAADNTADADKPVSGPQQAALNQKADRLNVLEKGNTTEFTPTADYHPATKRYTDDAVAGVTLGQIPDGTVTSAKLAAEVIASISAKADAAETVAALAEKAAAVHASRHAAGGSDPLTPAQIGAALDNHTHTLAQLGAAAASHNHDASAITSGILPAARGGTGVSSLAALASALGAAKSVIGSYQGTDLAGFNNKTSITLPFAPKLLIVDGMRPVDGGKWYGCLVFCFFTSSSACTVFNGSTSENVSASISGNTISWYADYDSSTYAQRSQSGTHQYLAIG